MDSSFTNEFKLGLQVFEVYSELVRDLINPSYDGLNLEANDAEGLQIKGLTTKWITDSYDLSQCIHSVFNLFLYRIYSLGQIEWEKMEMKMKSPLYSMS